MERKGKRGKILYIVTTGRQMEESEKKDKKKDKKKEVGYGNTTAGGLFVEHCSKGWVGVGGGRGDQHYFSSQFYLLHLLAAACTYCC